MKKKSKKIFIKKNKFEKNKLSVVILLDGNKSKFFFNDIQVSTNECSKTNLIEIVNEIKSLKLIKTVGDKMNWAKIKQVFNNNKKQFSDDMKQLNKLRSLLVNELKKNYCSNCNFVQSGSGSLTSDIDVNVSKNNKNDYFAVKEIKEMYNVLKCLFDDVESLITLDVNFYGHSFVFPINVGNLCTKNKYNEFIPVFDYELERKNKFQEAFAILKIIKYDLPIFNYNFNYDECKKTLNNFNSLSIFPFELFDYVKEDINTTFQNKLYFNQMELIEQFTNRIEKDIKKTKLDSYFFINEISKASMFADETYFTFGAFMHIVYFTQMKRNVYLNTPIFIHSMLENFGDVLKVKSHGSFENEIDFIKNASKYMMRIYDAILKTNLLIDSENIKICYLFTSFFNIREEMKKENSNELIILEETKKIYQTIHPITDILQNIKNDVVFVYKNKFGGVMLG
jgi:hypothetical protein